jgi:hypothetical protein
MKQSIISYTIIKCIVLAVLAIGFAVHYETANLPDIDRSIVLAEMPSLDESTLTDVESIDNGSLTDGDTHDEASADALPEISPDDYDGNIVIATADEVITMTVDADGIKHFTNHFITAVG